MYSAATSPPRWPVPRPSRRSWERKRTWVSILLGRMLCMAGMAVGGRCEWKRDSARGFGDFCCAHISGDDNAAIGNRTAASRGILRINRAPQNIVVNEGAQIVIEKA